MNTEAEEYLGDGLYARFDGFAIVLRAPREHGDHWVALEPGRYGTFERLLAFADKSWAHLKDSKR